MRKWIPRSSQRTARDMSIDCGLHSVNKEWKVYDLVIEDISVVNNYRSQFGHRIIARSSFEELRSCDEGKTMVAWQKSPR